MGRKVRAAVLVFCSCLALGSLAGAAAQQKTNARYDGHWWLSITPHEQYGFLNGFTDCYDYEYEGPDRYIDYDEDQKLITAFYEKNASQQALSVPEVLHKFRYGLGQKPRPGGELVKGRHGYYDGLYWRQISEYSGPEREQLGFVEGYLWCHANLSRNKGGVFSKPPAEYVRLITQWYGFHRETDDVDAKREPEKIADVLFRFRDQPQSSKRMSSPGG